MPMEPESGISTSRNPSQFSWVNLSRNLMLAYQSFGVVYGDLSTSPLYVYKSTFVGKLQNHQNEDTIFGAFSLIFWTLTLIPLLKYVFIVLSADDNGEGGTFALYSLLCRHAKLGLLPNQQAADEELSAYRYGPSRHGLSSSPLKRFLEKHKKIRTALLLVVLFGACMVIGDGVITPAISVLSSVSGLQVNEQKLTDGEVLLLACVILVGLFALQHYGTHRVAFMFAPIVIIWLVSIFAIGLYNIIQWNPRIVRALSPHYIINFFSETGKDGWISLGGILLSITGTEAMFADLGHFTALSIRLAFAFLVYPCLVVQYMGQAAYLSRNIPSIPNSFFASVPDAVFWPVLIIATLAAIVGSQAIITATFSIVKQCHALGCFPRVKVVHTSKHIYGQIYIPEINWILMIITLAITIGFQDTTLIGNAYGLACMTVMFVTTCLMALVLVFVWQRSFLLATPFLLFFGFIEGVYLSSALMKVPQGGWVSLVLSFIFMVIMFVWHYGTRKKYNFDLHNKVPLRWLLGLGPSLGIVRVPGIGLVYSELATGVPAIFSHFVTNLPAFHTVLVFVCVKSVPVPYVSPEERFLIGRICPRPYRMYRCIVRYGYKDIQRDDGDFENQLIQSIAEFIQMEAVEPTLSSSDSASFDGRMAVISTRTIQSSSCLIVSEQEDFGASNSIQSSRSLTLQSLRSSYDDENPSAANDERGNASLKGGAEYLLRKLRYSNIPTGISYGPGLSAHEVNLLKGTAELYSFNCFNVNASSLDDTVNEIVLAWREREGRFLYVASKHNEDLSLKLSSHGWSIVTLNIGGGGRSENSSVLYIDKLEELPLTVCCLSRKAIGNGCLIVGYIMKPSREEDFAKRGAFPLYPNQNGLIFMPITFELPILSQLQEVDVVLHKATDEIVSTEMSTSSEFFDKITYSRGIQEMERYIEHQPAICVVDPLNNIFPILDRFKIQQILLGLENLNMEGHSKIRGPHFLKVDKFDEPNLVQRLLEAKLTLPSIVKPQVACGVADAHSMAIVFRTQDYSSLSVPLPAVVQEYVDHSSTLFKFYVLGERVFYAVKKSTPNADCLIKLSEKNGLKPLLFDSLKSLPTAKESQHCGDGECQKADHQQIDLVLVTDAACWLRRMLDLTIFGFDVVIQEGTGDHVIVDVNYLPSFKEVPDNVAIPAFWEAIKRKYDRRIKQASA